LFHDDSYKSGLKEKRKIKSWIISVIENENLTSGNINFIFQSDEDVRKINIAHLSHNYYTDIITFDYSDGKILNGDIFISVERVAENARKFHVEKREEMLRVIVHGILHLIGFKDSSKSEKNEMRNMEDKYLKDYFSL